MKWKLAIFDWDGTLVDSTHMAYLAFCAIFKEYGCEPPTEEVYRARGNSNFMEMYYSCGVPRSASRLELNRIWTKFFVANEELLNLREHAREILSFLAKRNVKIAMVSGSTYDVILPAVQRLGIAGYFDHIQCDACGKVEELRSVLTLTDTPGHQAFYVDDTAEGNSAANKVGLTSIAIEGGFNPREALLKAQPTHLISSLREIEDIL